MQRDYRKISANTAWTEIYAVIKGGIRAATSYIGYVHLEEYLHEEASSFLTGKEKRAIYFAFLSYEKWKANVGAYDFMDVVQHVWKNRFMRSYYYGWYGSSPMNSLELDYLLVDEV
jgi:hypothetical protein